ncbi:Lysophospholipase 1 [Puccinia graminis f. sp. tritici]|uniref:Lysophospholipase n=1 Tax=Puccinia graminis f. sp. tritici TaxID=56615 RepID=A0A5B0PCM2_PUCGR|nr:Lysophospholipase 1 [Puccinia graminis f. sp. tritici]
MAFLLALLYFLSIFSSTYILGQDHSYAPQNAECPSTSLIRAAGTVTSRNQALGTKESLYIRERRKTVVADAYEDYMKNVESSMRRNRARLPEYVKRILLGPSDHLPRVSGAMSGGGLRASFVGAGILNALDGRNQTSASKGTGGLLQVMDYITGLSGGACLVMSLSQANFPSIYELTMGSDTDATEGWLAEMNFVAKTPLFLDTKWWVALGAQVSQKALAGFEVSLGDVYSRILAYHFVNGTTRENFFDPQAEHGLEERLSDLSSRYSQPFPIITSVAESPGQGPIIQRGDAVPLSNNQYEFNMYESGSWDPNLASFIETSYLGSPLENGRPSGAKACPKAYRSFLPALKGVLSLIPNPFYGLGTSEYLDRNSKTLQLMDGSFGGVPAREVDAIVAFDASDDVNGWPDGTSLKATSRRSKLLSNDVYPFPRIPESLSQIKITRPTFFGCDEPEVPLVIYIPNSPSTDGSTEATNLPTASLEVSQSRAFSLIEGGTKLASRGISNDPLLAWLFGLCSG